jgi:starch phosphorylase
LSNPIWGCFTSYEGLFRQISDSPFLYGWWPEGFNGKNGWAFGEEAEADRDSQSAEAIYAILEQQAVPLYYQVNDEGIPVDWVKMMRAAMKSCGPFFSARRDVFSSPCGSRIQGMASSLPSFFNQ